MNIEKKRIKADTIGWFGDVNLSFAAERNVKNVFSMASGVHLAYYSDNYSILVLSEYRLIRAQDENFSNTGFGHIRFDKDLGERVQYEAFTQMQYNKL